MDKQIFRAKFDLLASFTRFAKEDRDRWADEYWTAFKQWSDFAFADAVDRWLRGDRRRTFPSPYELKASVAPETYRRNEMETCGKCQNGMVSRQGQTYRCSCSIGHKLDSAEWRKVKFVDQAPAELPVDPADPVVQKGYAWMKKHAPELLTHMPERVKQKIESGVPF